MVKPAATPGRNTNLGASARDTGERGLGWLLAPDPVGRFGMAALDLFRQFRPASYQILRLGRVVRANWMRKMPQMRMAMPSTMRAGSSAAQ